VKAKADLQAWQSFIETIFLADTWVTSDHLKLFSNVSESLGYAAVFGSLWFGSLWFARAWPSHLQHYHIVVKELLPIVLALKMWVEQLKKIKSYHFFVIIKRSLSKQSCKNKSIMKLIRRLVLAALKLNVVFRVKYIAGKRNVIADQLSRFQFQKVRSVAPWLCQGQTAISDQSLII
jgi:hypothetical protein